METRTGDKDEMPQSAAQEWLRILELLDRDSRQAWVDEAQRLISADAVDQLAHPPSAGCHHD